MSKVVTERVLGVSEGSRPGICKIECNGVIIEVTNDDAEWIMGSIAIYLCNRDGRDCYGKKKI